MIFSDPNGLSLHFLSLYAITICIGNSLDGAGGSISNRRSLLSAIVLTPWFLNAILENFPVLPPKQVELGKDVSVNWPL